MPVEGINQPMSAPATPEFRVMTHVNLARRAVFVIPAQAGGVRHPRAGGDPVEWLKDLRLSNEDGPSALLGIRKTSNRNWIPASAGMTNRAGGGANFV